MSRRRTAWLIFLACLVVYNANLRYTGSADSFAASRLPFRILSGHGLTLDDPTATVPAGVRYSYWRKPNGDWISLYPILTPLAVTPLYVPAVLLEKFRPWLSTTGVEIAMQKLSASLLAALSAVILFLTLCRVTSKGLATLLAVAYAFGTSTWAISSQALWQHAMAGLLLVIALWRLANGFQRPVDAAFLGTVAALLAANRPTDILFSIALAVIVLRDRGRRSWPFFLSAALIGVLLVAYNLTQFGAWTGGYARFPFPNGRPFGFGPIELSGFLGILFSNRGIFFFWPFTLLFFFRNWRAPDRLPGLRILLVAYLASLLLHGLAPYWMGGYCYGPRYAIHGLPVLIVALASPLERVWKFAAARIVFVAAVVLSIGIQFIGAFFYPNGDSGDERYGPWTIRNSSPLLALRAGIAMPDFAILPRSVRRPVLGPPETPCRLAWDAPPPAALRFGESSSLRVRVKNESGSRWSSVGNFFNSGAVRIRWVWKDERQQPVYEFARWLAWKLDPTESVVRTVTVTAPPVSGRAVLEIGLEQVRVGPFPHSTCAPLQTEILLNQ